VKKGHDEEDWEYLEPEVLKRKEKEREHLGRWRFNKIGCLLCGAIFSRKTYGEALKLFVEHHLGKHEGQHDSYMAIGEPLDSKADKEAGKVRTFREALKLEQIWREHGVGWYKHALARGIEEALSLIPHEEELAAQALKIMAEGRPATEVGPRGREIERKEKAMEWTQQ